MNRSNKCNDTSTSVRSFSQLVMGLSQLTKISSKKMPTGMHRTRTNLCNFVNKDI